MIALDASALLAFLLRERGHQKVRQVLGESRKVIFIFVRPGPLGVLPQVSGKGED